MNSEIAKWQELRNRADELLKRTLNNEQKPHSKSSTAKALVTYARSDLTIKCLQMNQKKH